MPPKKGQRQARGIARQRQILAAALELFAAHGYRVTTLAMVADKVGITEAGVLHHFPSKQALLLAALASRDSDNEELTAWLAEPGGGLESLRRFPAQASVLLDQELLVRLHVVVGAESIADGGPSLRFFKDRSSMVRKGMAAMLRAGVRRGEFRADLDIQAKADEITAFMEGIQIHWLLDPESIDLVRAYQHYADTLERDLCSGA